MDSCIEQLLQPTEFSSGGDLVELGTLQSAVEAKEYTGLVQAMVKRIFEMKQITIALVDDELGSNSRLRSI